LTKTNAITATTTNSGIDVVSQYFVGCYLLLCRLLRDSLSRQQKTNIIRSYPIHRNLRPSGHVKIKLLLYWILKMLIMILYGVILPFVYQHFVHHLLQQLSLMLIE
jgi:hypothetical protein